MNALIEKSSKRYIERMRRWVDEALEDGVRFFVTSLGDPRWVAEKAHAVGGVVYHDVTEAKWAAKARDGGADGLIAVNRRAGGHAGPRDPRELLDKAAAVRLPVVSRAASAMRQVRRSTAHGPCRRQCGTRFIATTECDASASYKAAIVAARERDVVLSRRITGVPLAVLDTPAVRRMGLKASSLERWLLKHPRTKARLPHVVRPALRAFSLKDGAKRETSQFWQAGKSVAAIERIEPAGEIVRTWAGRRGCAEAGVGNVAAQAQRHERAVGPAGTRRTVRSRRTRIACRAAGRARTPLPNPSPRLTRR
jgi:nitronate monooxygenase